MKSILLERSDERGPFLTGWKEICTYVGRAVRTVQRWERKQGFPVRRLQQGPKSTVFAAPAEIDAWVMARGLRTGPVGFQGSDRATLIRSNEDCLEENAELVHQLQYERSKRK
jgi:predicted DNA-binding transcriptional regulator AlpA